MDLCHELEKFNLNTENRDSGGLSDNDTTIKPARQPSSVHSNPFDEELPEDFTPRSLEWFLNPRPDPEKPIDMFWTDHENYYTAPSTASAAARINVEEEQEEEANNDSTKGKFGTMRALAEWFVPRRRNNREWTIGAPLPTGPFRRASVNTDDLSLFQLARPPTPPRRRSPSPETMSDKPLPPPPMPRRFASEGNQTLIRSESTHGQLILSSEGTTGQNNLDSEGITGQDNLDSESATGQLNLNLESSSTSEADLVSIINAYNDSTVPETIPEEPSMNGEVSRPNGVDFATGPHLLVRLHGYHEEQTDAIFQMETTLSNPHMKHPIRMQFIVWSQQLIDIDCPFRVNLTREFSHEVKITERDAHRIVNWAIEVATKLNHMHDRIIECMNVTESVRCELRDMSSAVDMYHGSLLPVEELYHKMADVVQKKCRSPRVHEAMLLKSFLNLFEHLLYIPFQNVKDRIVVVRDEYPHRVASIPLDINTPVALLKRIFDAVYIGHGEYSTLTRIIREEFFVPIEERIPGVSSRTEGYLNNVVGFPNVI